MSVIGMWMIGAIPDSDAADLLARLSAAASQDVRPTAFSDLAAWWNGGGDQEIFFGTVPGRPWETDTESAERLMGLVNLANSETEASESVWDACLDLMSDREDDAIFVSSARKGSPIMTLCYALGAARIALLPGTFGNVLLRHSDIDESLRRVEQALDLSGSQRAEATHRMRAWLDETGDAPHFDGDALLTSPQRVLRHAAATGQGVAAFSRWY